MDTIRTFLENLFGTLPKTKEVLKAKEDLYEMMVGKYHDFKNEGKTENEAVGLVISEFGNITELLDELGVAPGEVATTQVDRHEAQKIIDTYKPNATKVAWGVMLIMTGVAITVLLGGYLEGDGTRMDVLSALPAILFLIPAVGLFISAGMAMADVARPLEEDFDLTNDALSSVTASADRYAPTYRNGVLTGVMTIIAAIIPFVLSGFFNAYRPALIAIGLLMIGGAVFLLIVRGVTMGIHNRLLKRGDHAPKAKKAEKLTDIVAGIVFPITVVVYLAWSFISKDWGITWIIWPIVGILFGVFAGTVESVMKNRK
jgi:uncharacterized membrane protein YGL010W